MIIISGSKHILISFNLCYPCRLVFNKKTNEEIMHWGVIDVCKSKLKYPKLHVNVNLINLLTKFQYFRYTEYKLFV